MVDYKGEVIMTSRHELHTWPNNHGARHFWSTPRPHVQEKISWSISRGRLRIGTSAERYVPVLRGLQKYRALRDRSGERMAHRKSIMDAQKKELGGLERVCGVSALTFSCHSCSLNGAGTSVGP